MPKKLILLVILLSSQLSASELPLAKEYAAKAEAEKKESYSDATQLLWKALHTKPSIDNERLFQALKQGADIASKNKIGDTPLTRIVKRILFQSWHQPFYDGMNILLKFGADPELENVDGDNAYDLASSRWGLPIIIRAKREEFLTSQTDVVAIKKDASFAPLKPLSIDPETVSNCIIS